MVQGLYNEKLPCIKTIINWNAIRFSMQLDIPDPTAISSNLYIRSQENAQCCTHACTMSLALTRSGRTLFSLLLMYSAHTNCLMCIESSNAANRFKIHQTHMWQLLSSHLQLRNAGSWALQHASDVHLPLSYDPTRCRRLGRSGYTFLFRLTVFNHRMLRMRCTDSIAIF